MADAAFTRSSRKPPNTLSVGPLSVRTRSAGLMLAAVACVATSAYGPAQAQVQVQPLAPPDLFSVSSGPSDLPPELWQGSSPALARTVIPMLGQAPLSPAAARLAHHVLSAGANGPEGAGDDAGLAAARADVLLQLGDVAAAQAIADQTPDLAQKTAMSQVAAETALIQGQEDKACAIGDALVGGRDGAFWLRLRAYCQVRAGQAPAAQLTFDLAEQQGKDGGYDRLMTGLLAGTDAGAPVLDNGLDVAVSRKAATGDWTPALATASAPVAIAIARDTAASPTARLAAASRAARFGAPVTDAYGAVSPIPADVATADQPGPAGEAGLVALANTATDFTIKQAAVVALLKRAGDMSEFQALARLAVPAIDQLVAAKAVLDRPTLFAIAAAAAGDASAATAARAEVGQGAAPPSPLDLALLDALIGALSGPPQGAAVDALDGASTGADGPAHARAGAAMAYLAALGAPVSAQARFDLAFRDLGSSAAPAGRLIALDLSARAGRMGDVALYVLLTATEAKGKALAPADMAACIRALDQAGLKADARAFAIEGLLAQQSRP